VCRGFHKGVHRTDIHYYRLKKGIQRTKEFEKKGLAGYAVNTGLKCGHLCTYCSTGAMVRAHRYFTEQGISAFDNTYAVVDPATPDRVADDARRIKKRGMIQLCTIVDAWAPEARSLQVGRRCLEAILSQPGWVVRILTKNASVEDDFDLIRQYKDRVLLGLSITATPDKEAVIAAIEPHASPIRERLRVLTEARTMGIRTYSMLCPLLPGIADSPESIDELVQRSVAFGAEEVFAEAVNPRGRGLILTQHALAQNGYNVESKAIAAIRSRSAWSRYVAGLIENIQRSMRRHSDISKLRFLLYPKGLEAQHLAKIREDDAGVVWL